MVRRPTKTIRRGCTPPRSSPDKNVDKNFKRVKDFFEIDFVETAESVFSDVKSFFTSENTFKRPNN